jgi:hypothetical protein
VRGLFQHFNRLGVKSTSGRPKALRADEAEQAFRLAEEEVRVLDTAR